MTVYTILNVAGTSIGNINLYTEDIPNFLMDGGELDISGAWVVKEDGRKEFRNFFLSPTDAPRKDTSEEIPFSVNWYRSLNEIKSTVFVAMLLQNPDGSGVALVLGVYLTKTEAEARCYRELQKLDYLQATAVVDCVLGVDLETVHSKGPIDGNV